MKIPHTSLSPEALLGLVEEFVTREGTDYGEEEVSLETKVSQVLTQIRSGLVEIRFDADNGTCGLFPVNPSGQEHDHG